MVFCGSSCSHRARIGPAPRFGTAPVEWELAIVDLLLVARLDAKSLLGSGGSAGRGCLRVGKWCDIGRGQPHQYLKRRNGHHKKRFFGRVRRCREHLQRTDTIEPACILCACRERHDVMNWRLHPCEQRDGSARLSAKRKRRILRTHNKLKGLIAPRPLRSLNEGVAAGGLEHLC